MLFGTFWVGVLPLSAYLATGYLSSSTELCIKQRRLFFQHLFDWSRRRRGCMKHIRSLKLSFCSSISHKPSLIPSVYMERINGIPDILIFDKCITCFTHCMSIALFKSHMIISLLWISVLLAFGRFVRSLSFWCIQNATTGTNWVRECVLLGHLQPCARLRKISGGVWTKSINWFWLVLVYFFSLLPLLYFTFPSLSYNACYTPRGVYKYQLSILQPQ